MGNARLLSSDTDDEKLLVRHIVDLARRSADSRSERYCCFLDERQLALCISALERYEKDSGTAIDYICDGGYENAERQVIIFSPRANERPFSTVVFTGRDISKLTHRDFLGVLMSTGIKREMIGDILVGEKKTVVFVMRSVLPVVSDIVKIGRVGVSADGGFSPDDIPEPQFDIINATVKSLRLDAVLSNAIGLSREKTQALIRAEGVFLDRRQVFDVGKSIDEGSTFSARGHGKYILKEVGGVSKKGRTFISIYKYK